MKVKVRWLEGSTNRRWQEQCKTHSEGIKDNWASLCLPIGVREGLELMSKCMHSQIREVILMRAMIQLTLVLKHHSKL